MQLKMHNILRVLVISLCLVCLGGLTVPSALLAVGPEKDKAKTVVYYFHTTGRCMTCMKMENYTNEALKTYFAEELKTGTIEWKVLDVEQPQFSHFVKDYGLYTKSVVLSEVKSGKEARWKNLDQIWLKVRDKDAYLAYIKGQIEEFRRGGKK